MPSYLQCQTCKKLVNALNPEFHRVHTTTTVFESTLNVTLYFCSEKCLKEWKGFCGHGDRKK